MINFSRALSVIAIWASFAYGMSILTNNFVICFVAAMAAIATAYVWDETYNRNRNAFDNDDDDYDDDEGLYDDDDIDDEEERRIDETPTGWTLN